MKGLIRRWRDTRKGFKPRAVEELIDYYWHRPLAGLLVQLLLPTPITPNQVTAISGVFSLLAGLALVAAARYHHGWALVAGLMLLCSIVFDCADGQLARLRGSSSTLGRVLDGFMDIAAPTCVFLGQAALLLSVGAPPLWVWPVGLFTALSLVWHASAYDVGKNLYLHCSRPDFSLGGDTLLSVAHMKEMRAKELAAGRRFAALLLTVWMAWTKPQMKAMRPWFGPERTPQDDDERALYVQHMGAQMRWLSWLGFGTHLFLLTLACWFAAWKPNLIWLAWLLISLPMNVVAAALAIGRGPRERRFVAALAQHRAQAR
ncbi:MAG TPA: CDP-alcohol phosphatidyltransferase family protein [Sorangium sp.]|nr:CDP-alcohol phosphatidyltransferase family protein [Sorangium sp.]